MRILFMGTPEFAHESLRALCDAGHDVCAVFTRPDAPKGRGLKLTASPVKEYSIKRDLTVYQPVSLKDEATVLLISDLAPELIVVVAYGLLLPQAVLDIPQYGCVNVHASLLPKYRGASPIVNAVAAGESETGVTTMYMAGKLDSGDIIMQKSTPIGARETGGELHDRLMQMGSVLLLNTVDLISRGAAHSRPQEHENATYTKTLSKADAKIDISKTAGELDAFVRGMNPWPCARLEGLQIHRAEPCEGKSDSKPGTILSGGLLVCGNGSLLRLLEVQPPGGRRMAYEDYARGHRH